MTRRKLVAGNWKMNGSRAALGELDGIAAAAAAHPLVDVAVAVPFTLIAPAAACAGNLPIGAEDVHAAAAGAFTGSVSATMVREAGARFTLVGHSERRIAFGERSHDIWGKAVAARAAGLGVILCCGENEGQRKVGRADNLVASQIELSVPEDAAADWLTIAYEPTWAIGTGHTPTPHDIVAMHALIRTKLRDLLGAERGEAVRILYGGSVNPSNAAEILALDNVDGALVGGASLTAASFVPIIEAAAAAATAS